MIDLMDIDLMDKARAAIGRGPVAQQDEAAELLLALDRLGPAYVASAEELAAGGEALAQTRRVRDRRAGGGGFRVHPPMTPHRMS